MGREAVPRRPLIPKSFFFWAIGLRDCGLDSDRIEPCSVAVVSVSA